MVKYKTNTICMCVTLVCALIYPWLVPPVSASTGDRSWIYQRCLKNKQQNLCSDMEAFSHQQDIWLRLTRWSCLDESKYQCMWHTVDAFEKDHSDVPQFHGKWPFLRALGMQEPASVIFSLLNGLAHLSVLRLRINVPSSTPMLYVWYFNALVCMHAWFWSVVFHARDTDFTEKMDYFTAFSIVICNTFALLCRIVGSSHKPKVALMALLCLGIYSYHIYYLLYVHFDYGYNITVNVAFGVCNAVAWWAWSVTHRHQQPYVWKCATVYLCLSLLVLLEVQDFPPYQWVFDAHSLWHASTVPLCLLWYSFVLDDCVYLSRTHSLPRTIKKLT